MFARLFLSGFCLLLAHSSGVAQQSRTLDPAAPLPETLEWLKANIPYNYTQPRNSERKELTREAITHVRTKGCTMNYEITSEPLEGAATRDHANGDLEQNEWRIELGRLNSRLVRLEAAQPDRAARILFASFDPGDPEVASKLKQSEPTIFLNYSNKAIWHSSRMGARRIREEFVSWGTIPVKNETLGAQIVAALVHAVDLCRQLTPAPAGP
ncbi:MAG TPA: hypothetical protein VE961_00560 [Pyrinomonadaceae bacterium]|nr:hypothetical protein [Pyrinomonadaceae bacterium]